LETKRQQQQMVRIMGSTRLALGKFQAELQREVKEELGISWPYGKYRITLADALEEALRRVGACPDSRVHDLIRLHR
jgi:hypothetical protein